MYAQDLRETKGFSIPEGYDGTAISTDTFDHDTIPEGAEDNAAIAAQVSANEKGRGLLSDLPIGKFLSGIFGKANLGLHKIGFEEILLAIGALYLFFAKDGDKECAIMLAILLFIN